MYFRQKKKSVILWPSMRNHKIKVNFGPTQQTLTVCYQWAIKKQWIVSVRLAVDCFRTCVMCHEKHHTNVIMFAGNQQLFQYLNQQTKAQFITEHSAEVHVYCSSLSGVFGIFGCHHFRMFCFFSTAQFKRVLLFFFAHLSWKLRSNLQTRKYFKPEIRLFV